MKLIDVEREALMAWWESEWPSDGSHVLDALVTTIEAIVARAVNEALTEAADAIESRMVRDPGKHPCGDRSRALREAARVVRARIT